MAKRPDPVAYARSVSRSQGGRTGWFDRNPDAVDVVKVWVGEWKSGRSRMGYEQARAYLRDHFGYEATTGALRAYIVGHYGNVVGG